MFAVPCSLHLADEQERTDGKVQRIFLLFQFIHLSEVEGRTAGRARSSLGNTVAETFGRFATSKEPACCFKYASKLPVVLLSIIRPSCSLSFFASDSTPLLARNVRRLSVQCQLLDRQAHVSMPFAGDLITQLDLIRFRFDYRHYPSLDVSHSMGLLRIKIQFKSRQDGDTCGRHECNGQTAH